MPSAPETAPPKPPQPAPPLTESRPPSSPRRRGFLLSARLGIVVIAAATVVLFAARWDSWVGARVDQTTDDAYVTGDITPLSAQVEGTVSAVAVGDFQRVKAGDLLVQIEDSDYRARVAQA